MPRSVQTPRSCTLEGQTVHLERSNILCLFDLWMDSNARAHRTLSLFRDMEWTFAVFGGVLRDLYYHGPVAQPRDIDIVVDSAGREEIAQSLRTHIQKENRFGGIKVEIEGVELDIWSLRDTWGLKLQNLEPTFENLIRTTFFNVESIAVVFTPGRSKRIVEDGFFSGISKTELDIVLEKNPYPALCVVRAFEYHERLGLSFSDRLLHYLYEYTSILSEDEIAHAWTKHYGRNGFCKRKYRSTLSKVRTLYESRPIGSECTKCSQVHLARI